MFWMEAFGGITATIVVCGIVVVMGNSSKRMGINIMVMTGVGETKQLGNDK